MTDFSYFLLALPNSGNEAKTVGDLHNILKSRGAKCSHLSRLPIHHLRVGTLDKLISLSDDFARIDAFGKNVVQKLHRTYSELEGTKQILSIKNESIHSFITNFAWDDGHFNPHAQLRDLVQSIHANVMKTAEHLRRLSAALTEIENNLSNISRKLNGSLMNKCLKQYVSHENWYSGEYLRTALIVIPTTKTDTFMANYEFMEESSANRKYQSMMKEKNDQLSSDIVINENSSNHANEEKSNLKFDVSHIQQKHDCRIVVPESAQLLTTDKEFSLYSVMLLNCGYDWFKFVCLQQGFNVRDFTLAQLTDDEQQNAVQELTKNLETQQRRLRHFCKNNFSDAFSNWMHLKMIRAFVESVLRYGLPIDFTITAVHPRKGTEKKLLLSLEREYKGLLDSVLQTKEENEVDYSGLSGDYYPFVYVPISLQL